jgi:HlyD family secretion protein
MLCGLPLISALFAACAAPVPFATGYVEGDSSLIAPVAIAQVAEVAVRRGDRVKAGQVLARMDAQEAQIALAEAVAALAQAQARLDNLREGARPEEIRVIEAELASATAGEAEASRTEQRIASLTLRGAATQSQLDDARTARDVAQARVAEVQANLAVARLPARPAEIAAAEGALHQAAAARDHAQWALDQRRLLAPADGVISDTLRTVGEIAGPSAPVLSMLPDGAVRLRLYVPEGQIARIGQGTELAVNCDSCAPGLRARITYVSDGPEFTPPVIYSLQNRQKLVYLIEAVPLGDAGLKPGQIVDVDLPG